MTCIIFKVRLQGHSMEGVGIVCGECKSYYIVSSLLKFVIDVRWKMLSVEYGIHTPDHSFTGTYKRIQQQNSL